MCESSEVFGELRCSLYGAMWGVALTCSVQHFYHGDDLESWDFFILPTAPLLIERFPHAECFFNASSSWAVTSCEVIVLMLMTSSRGLPSCFTWSSSSLAVVLDLGPDGWVWLFDHKTLQMVCLLCSICATWLCVLCSPFKYLCDGQNIWGLKEVNQLSESLR